MKATVTALVVDASVAVKLFAAETDSAAAAALFARLGDDPPLVLVAPELLFVECANVFRTRCKRGAMTAAEAKRALAVLRAFPWRVLSTADLSPAALDFALAHDLTAYDATYAAAAESLGIALVAADQKLAAKLARAPIEVEILAAR